LVCGKSVTEGHRFVLVRGRRRRAFCSEACLRDDARTRRIAKAKAERRWFLRLVALALVPAAANILWRRTHAPSAEVISSSAPEPLPEPPAPEPIRFGPAWPPTEADWAAAFAATSWIYPLPGPVRRAPEPDGRIFGPEPHTGLPALCRKQDHCGVDLGGDLWGEHVYAAHDGVLDRVRSSGDDERGGQYVRLSHLGGMVFTQYFHLAAIPRGLARGVRVKAGDVIGLLGDTGIKGSRRHLYFALSVRPSTAFPEIYWDPGAMMATWPLRLPVHGTVAGLAPAAKESEASRHRRPR
jgi:murein DD-endopeptidase MepM/ murein hydrolase activator NlpD